MHHAFGAPVRQVETPQVLPALLFGHEQQGLGIVFPAQRCMHVVIPFAAVHRPAAAFALPHAQLRRHGVLAALVAGQESQTLAVGAVAWCAHVPGAAASKAKATRRPSGDMSKALRSGSARTSS
jgi:hypothetical protein